MAVILTSAILKGGSGKTTTAVNLACALASAPHSKRVLLVDLDPQNNASLTLGLVKPNKQPRTVCDLLDLNSGITFSQAATKSKFESVDLIPSNMNLFAVGNQLVNGNPAAVMALQSKLDAEAMERYDYIILDTPPAAGPFVSNAMLITDYFIIPVECGSTYALTGMEQFIGSIKAVRACSQHRLNLLGVLLTRFDARTTASKVVEGMAVQMFGDLVFKTRIRRATAVEQANMAAQPILQYDKRSMAAQDYASLAEEVMQRIAAS